MLDKIEKHPPTQTENKISDSPDESPVQSPDESDLKEYLKKYFFNNYNYKTMRVIETGGMGIIYILRDQKCKWDFAAKILKFSTDKKRYEERLEKFSTEIEHLIEMPEHPNIVRIESVKTIEFPDNQRPCIFMEYVDGGDLGEKLSNAEQHKLNFDIAMDYAFQICEGMQIIHDKGNILHLDIKPENFLITHDQVVKISDFGLSQPSLSLSRIKTYQRRGTRLYMSPEQMKGESVDISSDIYSFGIVLYEMLMGNYPYPFDVKSVRDKLELKKMLLEFHESSYDFHNQLFHQTIIPGISPEIGTIIGHCLAKLPIQRIPDFGYLQRWLERSFGNYKKKLHPQNNKLNFYRKGLSLQAIGKHSKALEFFNLAIMMNSSSADLWNDVAKSLEALGMLEDAERYRNQAYQIG